MPTHQLSIDNLSVQVILGCIKLTNKANHSGDV